MNENVDVSAFVDSMAKLVEMPIPEEYREGVIANFERIQAIAQLVMNFPLSEEVEAAPTFDP
jgi:hypothetical protein